MLVELDISTEENTFYNITANVRKAVFKSGVKDGICVVFCPHTTAGVTISENADPFVTKDMLLGLEKAFPYDSEFLHAEGNSTAHVKSNLVGSNHTIIVNHGELLLGKWQAIYLCEFDGPRERKVYVKVL